MAVSIKIDKRDENNNIVYTYNFANFKSIVYAFNSPVVSTPIPNEPANGTVLLKLEGNTTIIKFNWTVKEHPTNQETFVGIATATQPDIIKFWGVLMIPALITDRYRLTINYGVGSALVFDGTVTNIQFNSTEQAPALTIGSFDFQVGSVMGGIYDTNGATSPNNFVVVKSASGQFTATWTAPLKFPNATAYHILYRTGSNDWTLATVGSGTLTLVQGGLTVGATYQVKMYGSSNSNGKGADSNTTSVTV